MASTLHGGPAKRPARVIVGAQVADCTGGPLRRANVLITRSRMTRIGVDGELAWEAGKPTGARSGRALRCLDEESTGQKSAQASREA